jgi:hypothetical protein
LAAAILRLASDGELRRRYGEAGCRRVEEDFSLQRCVAACEALYGGLLEGDANLTMPPEALPKCHAVIETGKAEFVSGTRVVYPMEMRQCAHSISSPTGSLLICSAFS